MVIFLYEIIILLFPSKFDLVSHTNVKYLEKIVCKFCWIDVL
jgi:hypothetical protein